MTKDEVIKYGKEQLDVFGGKHAEFIKSVIELLEQGNIGEWLAVEEKDKKTYSSGNYYYCSNCKDYYTLFRRAKYCPNCGAKMKMSQTEKERKDKWQNQK